MVGIFFDDAATTQIYPLSLRDPLPIWASGYQVGMVGAARLLAWIRGEDEGPSGRRDALDVNLILRGSSHG